MMFQYFHHKSTRQVLHLYISPGHIWNVREKRWKCAYFGALLAFVARIFFQSISNEYYLFSMLSFTFHSQFLFFEVWTIPVLFLSIATSKVPLSGWYPLEQALFFKNDPWWFGPFPNTITQRFLWKQFVFPDCLSISCDYDITNLVAWIYPFANKQNPIFCWR